MIVYVHCEKLGRDVREPLLWHKVSDQKAIVVPRAMSVAQIVTAIQRGRNKRSIWLLHLNAHGRPGVLLLGKGINKGNAASLSPLRQYMTPRGKGVFIHGCNIAADFTTGSRGTAGFGRGYQLLKTIARVMAVPVTGGVDVQWGQSRNTKGVFWGPVVTVQPNGNPQLWQMKASPRSVRP